MCNDVKIVIKYGCIDVLNENVYCNANARTERVKHLKMIKKHALH